MALKIALFAQPPCSAEMASLTVSSGARGLEDHIQRDPTEKKRWCTATNKIREFVDENGLNRKEEEPRGVSHERRRGRE